MMSITVERIANLACLLEEPLQEKLWEYAELLYVEQVAFESTDPSGSPEFDAAVAAALYAERPPHSPWEAGSEDWASPARASSP